MTSPSTVFIKLPLSPECQGACSSSSDMMLFSVYDLKHLPCLGRPGRRARCCAEDLEIGLRVSSLRRCAGYILYAWKTPG
jgi:hypothetical protein